MPTQRPAPRGAAPRSKSRNDGTQPTAQQSSAQAMVGNKRPMEDADRQRNALENQGAQGRKAGGETWTREQLLRENDDDETATRH